MWVPFNLSMDDFLQARFSRSRHPPNNVHNGRSTWNFWNVWNLSLVHEASYPRRVGSQHFCETWNVRSIQDDRLKADFKLIASNIHVSQLYTFIDNYELLMMETARKYYPVLEKVNNVMIAPQDYDVRHPDESSNSTTETSGYDPQIYPGMFLNTRDEAKNGAQTKGLRVLIGCQLIGTDQTHKNITGQSHLYRQWGHLHRSSQGHPWRRK